MDGTSISDLSNESYIASQIMPEMRKEYMENIPPMMHMPSMPYMQGHMGMHEQPSDMPYYSQYDSSLHPDNGMGMIPKMQHKPKLSTEELESQLNDALLDDELDEIIGEVETVDLEEELEDTTSMVIHKVKKFCMDYKFWIVLFFLLMVMLQPFVNAKIEKMLSSVVGPNIVPYDIVTKSFLIVLWHYLMMTYMF